MLSTLPGHEPGQFPIGSHHPTVLVVDDRDSAYEEQIVKGDEFTHPPFDSGPDS